MSSEIIALIQPQLKTVKREYAGYAAVEGLEQALRKDTDFMDLLRESRISWPGEAISLSSISHWLLSEAERCGSEGDAYRQLIKFLGSPRQTWRQAIVCTDVLSQHLGRFEPWRFDNGVIAFAAGVPEKYKAWTNDALTNRCLVFLDEKNENRGHEAKNYTDFVERVFDCCRSLSFFSDEGAYIRPSYHTYAFERSAPFPLGSCKGRLSSRKNQNHGVLTGATYKQANVFLSQMYDLEEENLDVVRRVLDRHAAAVAWGDLENRAIEARVCMEMVLMRNSKGDNAFKVSRRAAHLMANDVVSRVDAMQRAKDLYDAGSIAVHGGSLTGQKKKDQELAAAVRGCHEFLNELVQAWILKGALNLKDEDWAVVELGGNFPTRASRDEEQTNDHP